MAKCKKIALKSCINGLNKLIEGDIPRNSINLVTGIPGTLKSSFTLCLMGNYLRKCREFGLYLTLEQSAESCVRNMESLGIKKPENLEITDFSSIRKKYREIEKRLDIVKVTEEIIRFYKKREGDGFSLFVLDSLNAFCAFALEPARREFYHFFNMLKESKLTSFIIVETSTMDSLTEYTPEYFLADSILELGALEKPDGVTRYLQIKKIRETAHSMKKHRISVGKGAITVLGPVYA